MHMVFGLTGDKAQGITIAKDKPFERAVLHFPTRATRNTTTGLEYVITSRIKSLSNFVFGNKVLNLDRNKFIKMGTSPTDIQHSLFQERIQTQYQYKEVDCPRVKTEIAGRTRRS